MTAWSALAGELLLGKYRKTGTQNKPSDSRRLDTVPFTELNDRNLSIAQTDDENGVDEVECCFEGIFGPQQAPGGLCEKGLP